MKQIENQKNEIRQAKYDRYTCEDEYGRLTEYEPGYYESALYIVFGHKCNADCEFCIYHDRGTNKNNGCTNKLDLKKLDDMLADIEKSGVCIQTVHLTGGEPTLDIENFKKVLVLIRKHLGKLVDTSVNTNGIHLNELGQLVQSGLLNNIALSRHGLTDKENQEIFKTNTIPTDEDIKAFVDKYGQVIHLSCNLIEGYVDSPESVVDYLEKAASFGINDVGIVSLMNKNQYCKDKYVDYSLVAKDIEKFGLVRTNQHVKRDNPCKVDKHGNKCGNIICACENYLYLQKSFRMVQMYHRFSIQSNSIESYLVYSDESIKQGFTGQLIKKY